MPSIKDRSVELPNCDFVAHQPQEPATSSLLVYYERLRAYVQHEDGLINSRLTWSLTVHGFLFAAFGLLAGKIADIVVNSPDPPSLQLQNVVIILMVLLLVIALVGVVVGILSRMAIAASHYAVQHLYSIAHRAGALRIARLTDPAAAPPVVQNGCMLFPAIIGGGDRGGLTVGARHYYLILPNLLTGVWFLILIGTAVCLGFLHPLLFAK
jgi:hypothetical protein